jgi:hypothetical protein
MAFLRLLDRVALKATGTPTTKAGTVAGPTPPASRPATAPSTPTIEIVATQVVRVVTARLGSWSVVFIWFLLGGVDLVDGTNLRRVATPVNPVAVMLVTV